MNTSSCPLSRLSKILRLVSLAILFGGSAATVFAAVMLVKAATAQGIPVGEAATANAPVFINFAKVALGAGVALLVAECLDFTAHRKTNRLTMARYIVSCLCVGTTMIFALGITPMLAELLPSIKTDDKAGAEFHSIHETSRAVFGATIFLALVSLILPVFESSSEPASCTAGKTDESAPPA